MKRYRNTSQQERHLLRKERVKELQELLVTGEIKRSSPKPKSDLDQRFEALMRRIKR